MYRFLRMLVAIAASCFTSLAAASSPVRIGFIGPLTGGSSDFGNSARFGAELAVKEINEVGGYMGHKLELVSRDDKGDPAVGLQASKELVEQQKVAFTIGFCNTGVAMRSLDVFQSNKHLLLVPCAQGTAVTAKFPAPESFIFRMAPPDRLNAEFLVNEAVGRNKWKRIAIFADRTGYGEGGLQDLTAELLKHNLKPVYVARFDLGVKSLTAQMQEAKAAQADAIISYAVGPEQVVAVRSRLEAKLSIPYLAPWPLSFRSVLDAAGPHALEGTMMVQTIVHDALNERRASFIAKYVKYTGEPRIGSLMAAAQSYDAVNLMLRVLLQTRGNTDSNVLKAALSDLSKPYAGVMTTYDRPFTEKDRDAVTENMLFLGVWRKGQIEYFYPEDAKRASYIRRKKL